jgi:choline dehydrogenase-like flavoprotein
VRVDRYRGPKAEIQSLAEAVAETARTVAASVAGQAKDVGLHAVSELSGTAEAGVAKGADAIDGIASAMKTAAAELEGTSPALAAGAVRLADQLESLTGNIRGRSPRELVVAAHDLARTHPILFVAGASLAGFALARFLKSSASGSTMPQVPRDGYDPEPSAMGR